MSEPTQDFETQPGDEQLAALADEFLLRRRRGECPSVDEIASRVRRVDRRSSPPPRQTVRADFPHTAFAETFHSEVYLRKPRSFTDASDRGRGREHRTTCLSERDRRVDFVAGGGW